MKIVTKCRVHISGKNTEVFKKKLKISDIYQEMFTMLLSRGVKIGRINP